MTQHRKFKVALDRGHAGLKNKVAIPSATPGKETPYIPELGRRIQEEEFNEAVVQLLKVELERCGFEVLLTAPESHDVSLKTRTDRANNWKADIFVSIHFNALDGKFDGVGKDPEGHSVHYYPGSPTGAKLAKAINDALVGGTVQKNRGIVAQDLHVVRETKMTAVLSENGFMDNKREALLMLSKDFQKEVAKEHAEGICSYFNVKYIEEPKPTPQTSQKTADGTFFRVVTGSFSDRENAERRISDLKKAGFDSFIDIYKK